jgi:DNA topoisomerase-1
MDDSYSEESFEDIYYNQSGGVKSTGHKWTTFSHNGVMFFPPYEPHKIPLLYDGHEIFLKPNSEEYATIYAKYTGTDYLNNKKFNKNFFNDWKKILKKDGHNEIVDIDKCDFTLMYDYLLRKKDDRAEMTVNDKEKIKIERERLTAKYKYAIVDGVKQEVGNFIIEPPGLYLGRGCNPLMGKIKYRILPEDIVINLDEKSKIPSLPNYYKNNNWGEIVHNHSVQWIASWYDNITGKSKYVWLSNKSNFKSKSDEYKFEMARKLKQNIGEIRRINNLNIITPSIDNKVKQLAVCLYLIDLLAIRVGGDKNTDETADTVGVTTLRVENISLENDYVLKLNFLGKDSILYKKTVKIDPDVFDNLIKFTTNKKKGDDLFDLINANMLNDYLKEMMPDLSAKIFRTFNSSMLFQEEIDKIDQKYKDYNKNDKIEKIKNDFVLANLKISQLCNHVKSINKNFSEAINKMDIKIKELKLKKDLITDKKKIKKINEKIRILKNKRDMKNQLRDHSLDTSMGNYIDPRLIFSLAKRYNIDIDNFLSKALVEKFFWAKDTSKDWRF